VNEPKRLLDQGRDDLAVRLLASADADGPGERSVTRALAAVSVAAATTAAASSTAAATGTLAGVLKWLGLGLLAGSVVAVSAGSVLSPAERAPAVATASPVVATVAAPPLRTVAALAPVPLAPTAAPSASPLRVAASGSASSAAHETVAPTAPNASVAAFEPPANARQTLADELRELDRARARLAAGDASGALGDVARFEARYPRGRLRQEAVLVRVEALAAAGRCADASSAAASFLAQHPNSVLAKRARSLLARCR
jgi:hypothetical protein